MTAAQIRNGAIYGLLGLLLVIASWARSAIQTDTVDWFSSPPASQYKGLADAVLGYLVPALTVLAAALRVRLGSEGISRDVKELSGQGVPRSEMTVVTKDAAARAEFTEEEAKFLRDEVARLRRIKPIRELSAAEDMQERRA